jgi:hypothetical protein
MKTPKTLKDLEDLIQNKTEENFSLEYKEARGLEDPKEIAKDISAMANSAGGIVIYGIAEKDHFPEKITPIDRKKFSKEWLENIVTSNISPKIEGLKIIPISVGEEVVYVVEIPQSDTAHQNTKDWRYYKRRNFKSEPMLDYEIRDILNRVKHPVVELIIQKEFVEEECEVEAQNDWERINPRYETVEKMYLILRPFNKGGSYAKFVNYFVELPKDILPEEEAERLKYLSPDCVEFYGENTLRDVLEYRFNFGSRGIPKYGSSRFDPILPKLYGRSEKILLLKNSNFDDREIKWSVHADNSPIQIGSIMLNKIPIKEC